MKIQTLQIQRVLIFLLVTVSTMLSYSHEIFAKEVQYTRKGADTCLKCHDEDNDYPVLPIFKTKHALRADSRTPFAQHQCEACHGPGRAHRKIMKKDDEAEDRLIIHFGSEAATPISQQNKQCLACHDDMNRINWQGSAHEANQVACASCHVIHTARDKVLKKTSQVAVCVACHTAQRAAMYKTSSHPLRHGVMACSDCHNPHGGFGPSGLRRHVTNDICYRCHAEKRGPFLWQHAPVSEDCTICHRAHGSNHRTLLHSRASLLCKQCHSPAGHPSLAPSGTGLPNGRHMSFAKFMVGKSCVNCHAQVHGSNHPSGVKFTR